VWWGFGWLGGVSGRVRCCSSSVVWVVVLLVVGVQETVNSTSAARSVTASSLHPLPRTRLAWYSVWCGWVSIRRLAADPTMTWDGWGWMWNIRDDSSFLFLMGGRWVRWELCGSRIEITLGIIGEEVSGSDMQSILPKLAPSANCWTHTTLFVVPRSIPAILALPRNPILAANPHPSTISTPSDGSIASMPPDGSSSLCLLRDLDWVCFTRLNPPLFLLVVFW